MSPETRISHTAAITEPHLDTVTPSVNPSVRYQTLDSISRQRILADDDLTEYCIAHSYSQLMLAPDDAGKRYWCDRLTWWVKQRSPTAAAS